MGGLSTRRGFFLLDELDLDSENEFREAASAYPSSATKSNDSPQMTKSLSPENALASDKSHAIPGTSPSANHVHHPSVLRTSPLSKSSDASQRTPVYRNRFGAAAAGSDASQRSPLGSVSPGPACPGGDASQRIPPGHVLGCDVSQKASIGNVLVGDASQRMPPGHVLGDASQRTSPHVLGGDASQRMPPGHVHVGDASQRTSPGHMLVGDASQRAPLGHMHQVSQFAFVRGPLLPGASSGSPANTTDAPLFVPSPQHSQPPNMKDASERQPGTQSGPSKWKSSQSEDIKDASNRQPESQLRANAEILNGSSLKSWLSGASIESTSLSDKDIAEKLRAAAPDVYED
jgi:hypothetical protein